MKKRALQAAIASLLAVALTASVAQAAMPSNVPFATMEGVSALLAESQARLVTAIDALAGRVETVEASDTRQSADLVALGKRIDTLASGGDDFWPIDALNVHANVRALALESFGWASLLPEIEVEASGPGTGPNPFTPQYDSIVRIEFEDTTYWDVSGAAVYTGSLEERPAAGTPITVEYWVESCGQRVHGTQVLADWQWQVQ